MGTRSDIYQDIATRTGGDIYIGVVGPVRSGKSTFIKRFMEEIVLPNMKDDTEKSRALDEMPQSGSGKTIMTTEPKFVPDQAVRIEMTDEIGFRVKLIDCVGFPIEGALGVDDEGEARMVNTPWSKDPLPFSKAAVLGTQRVMSEHSTVAIVVTTDGSFGEIGREHYVPAEEAILREMRQTGKPFVVILNSQNPTKDETLVLAEHLQDKYGVPVLPANCFTLKESDICIILSKLAEEFPLQEIFISMPSWLTKLDANHPISLSVREDLDTALLPIRRVSEMKRAIEKASANASFDEIRSIHSDLGSGKFQWRTVCKRELFYQIVSESAGVEIKSDEELIRQFSELAGKKTKYQKIAYALEQAEETGYGIVTPDIEDLMLEEPEIVKQSGGYGVKLKASAPSIHLIRANIEAEISPIVGSERQSEDIVKFLLKEFEEDPTQIWHSNMFGKSLYELVNESLNTKLNHMPQDARAKLGETLQKIINEGSGGLICIIL